MNISKISLGLNLASIIAIIYLFSQLQNLKKTTSNELITGFDSTQGPSISFPSNLVFINIDSIDAQLQIVKDLRKDMAAAKTRSEASLKAQYKALETEFIKAQEDSKYYTQEQATKKQNELMIKEQNLMKLEQELSEKLLKEETEKNKELQKTVQNALKDLQKSNQYSFVFGYNGWGNLIYANDSMDITKEVVEYINKKGAKN